MAKTPFDKVGVHRVDKNLYIRVRPSGSSFWITIHTIKGKRKEVILGSTNDLSLRDVKRLLANNARKPSQEDITIITDNKVKVITVTELINEAIPVIEANKKWKNKKHSQQWRNTLNQYVIPHIGSRDITTITRKDIYNLLSNIWHVKTETAKRVRGRLEMVFNYAIAMDYFTEANPCVWKGNLEMFLPIPSRIASVSHFESLTLEETKNLCILLAHKKSRIYKSIIFGILTASRVNEFIRCEWNEIDFTNKIWFCPPSKRKDGKTYPHRVPLSTQALEVLNSIDKVSNYVFYSAKDIDKPMHMESPRITIKKLINKGTMHGFRSTFRDWAAESGYDRVLAEKSLMHTTGTEVERAYQRSDLLEQRRVLMQLWANTLFPYGINYKY